MNRIQLARKTVAWIVAAGVLSAAFLAVWDRPRAPAPAADEQAAELRTTAVPLEPIAPVKLGPPGRLRLTASVPPAYSSVAYAVISAGGVVTARGTLPVTNGQAAPQEISLPSGGGTVTFVGTKTDGGVSRIGYLGTRPVQVTAGSETSLHLTAQPGAEAATPDSLVAGSPIAIAATSSTDSTVACRSCEMASGHGICDSPNITATSSTDPKTGEQTGIGWGCATLPDGKAQTTCLALLRCLNATACGRPGENPVGGCYCGAAAPEACLGGQGITGACIAEYQAAAAASPGGPSSGAAIGQLSQFIGIASSDPTTPIGLADNIKHCAMETRCDACEAL